MIELDYASKVKNPTAFIASLFVIVERSKNSVDLKLVGEYVKRELEKIKLGDK